MNDPVFLGIPKWLADKRDESGYTRGARRSYQPSRWSDDYRETNLLRDVAFNRHSMNDGHHVSPSDNNRIQVGTDGITVRLVQGIDEKAFKRTLSMAQRATIGIDLEQEGKERWEPCDAKRQSEAWTGNTLPACAHPNHRWNYVTMSWDGLVDFNEDWQEMLKGGLQTALETQVIVFAVSGLSRTCTHQLVRSRRGAFHQQSQRASFYGDRPELRMPESVWRNDRAREAFKAAYDAAALAYQAACEEDISYQDARYALPEGTTNYIMCEYPVREFLNVYAYRACSMFSWEIVHTVREMGRLLMEAHPWLAPHIKISCQTSTPCGICGGTGRTVQQTHGEYGKVEVNDVACSACGGLGKKGGKCTFQGWESVEGQCPLPWAKESNRVFRSEHHRIERKEERPNEA